MSLKKKCEDVLKNVDHSSYDSVQGAMESILKMLGEHGTDPYLGTAISKIEVLREEANILKEKEEREAKQANDNVSNTEAESKKENQDEKAAQNDDEKQKETENKQTQPKQSTEINQNEPSNPVEQTSQSSKCCLLI